jgi:hypothetical protein
LQLDSVHVPVMQDSVALGRSHDVPHDPQSMSVRSEVSQPLGLLPSQLPQPELQLVNVHEPDPHDAPTALAGLHAVPQLPQFVRVVSGASQPLAWLPSQLP